MCIRDSPGGGVALGEKVQIVLEIEADLNP